MENNLQYLYKKALDARAPWINRWDAAMRYTMPVTDDDAAQLFDATASDAVDNLAASIYSLMTPPESLWLNLVPESEKSPDAVAATDALRAHLNDSNFYTTIHQCYYASSTGAAAFHSGISLATGPPDGYKPGLSGCCSSHAFTYIGNG